MPKFRPPKEKRATAGEFHVLDQLEARFLELSGVIKWNVEDQVYELAPDKIWEDYIQYMRELPIDIVIIV